MSHRPAFLNAGHQGGELPLNATTRVQKKKPTKAPVKRAKKKAATAEPKQNPIKRLLFGEEKPDLSELEAGATTILDILSPTAIDTKSRDYILVDGVYHAYLYVAGYGYSTTVGSCWLAPPGGGRGGRQPELHCQTPAQGENIVQNLTDYHGEPLPDAGCGGHP